jgi:uroporphyrinogen decarboxylase
MGTPYTGKEYIAAVFRGERSDRVPVRVFHGLRPGLELAGVTAKEVRTEPEKYVRVLAALYEVVPQDAISILIADEALLAEAAGKHLGLTFADVRARAAAGTSLLEDKSTLAQFELPDLEQGQRLPYFLEICQGALRAIPDAAVDPMFTSPWSTAMLMRGPQSMLLDVKDDPAFLRELLSYTTEMAKMVGAALLQAGADVLTIADPSAGPGLISPTMFREWVEPCLRETINHLKQLKDTPVLIHICGYVDPIMEDLVGLGVDGISIDAPSSLKRLVETSQGRAVVEGNCPTGLFLTGTPEDIEAQVRECVDVAAAGNAYILCSGCQVPDSAPLENVRHFLEFGRRYGRYENAVA